MTPPQEHMHLEVLLSAGIPPIRQVAEPGTQGAVTGMQGMGVKTPSAAAVAAATVGLAMDIHMPKVGMLVMGMESAMLAAGAVACPFLIGTKSVEALSTPKQPIIKAP